MFGDVTAATRTQPADHGHLSGQTDTSPNPRGAFSGRPRVRHEEQRGQLLTMPFRRGSVEGLWIFDRATHADERGFFHEAFRAAELEEALGEPRAFVQVNHSRSTRGVLRGLHAENWEKLVYVPHGDVFTAVADIRPHSPTFGRVETFRLGEENRLTLFLPAGVAHGYCVLSDSADYTYQVTAYYDGSDTRAVAWDDPDLAVAWPLRDPLLSARDQHNPRLRQLLPECFVAGLVSTPA
jgi:dTDP-4-dehydrorhamnose 3,5-epimerase